MKDRIALVTGADKSIGLEAVRGLARLGFTVYLTSLKGQLDPDPREFRLSHQA